MLRYNFIKILKIRRIDKPYNFLRKQGFTHNMAHRISRNRINRLSLENVEKLCLLFSCIPHDLLEWQSEDENADKQPLSALQKQINPMDFRFALRTIPYSRLAELQMAIEKIQKGENPATLLHN